PGHLFSDGKQTLVVTYTIPPKNESLCPKDANATITVTPATCEAPGSAAIGTVQHATWDGKLETEPGDHSETFTAVAGHFFANGEKTLVVNYTIPPKDTSLCPTDAVATITVTPGTCEAPGSASIGELEHATWDGKLETEPGSHTETFTAAPGHLFSNGTSTLAANYTSPPKDA